MIIKAVNLWLGFGPRVVIPVSQFDTMWQFVFSIVKDGLEWTIPTGASAVLNGLKPDGNVFAFSGTISGNTVTVDCDVQMTAVAGDTICELSILADGKTVGTANFTLAVEAAPKSPNDVSSDSTLPAYEEMLEQMGNIAVVKFPSGIKSALLSCFRNVAWATASGQDYYNNLYTALYGGDVVSISAVFTQGEHIVYTSDSLDTLKQCLVVTAYFESDTTAVLQDDDYELSGTLEVGTSTITVTYAGKTDTFDVTVTQSVIPSGYTLAEYVASPNQTTGGPRVNTGVTPSTSGNLTIEISFMMLAEASGFKYVIAMASGAGVSTVGICVGVPGTNEKLTAFNGVSSNITPNGGSSVLNKKLDAVATFTSTSSSITDGTLTDSNSGTGRNHGYPIYLFGLKDISGTAMSYIMSARVYSCKVTDGDTVILNLIPCIRNSDNAAGFWDTVNENFITDTGLVAG